MKKHLRLAPILALAAFLAGCQGPCDKIESISGPSLSSGTADFSTYAAVGTSISAGWQSGGLVDRHQVHAFPALFAHQVGKTVLSNGQGSFTMPTVDRDGQPALLKIQSFSPLIISTAGQTAGAPENYSQNSAYHNLAVPGSLAFDFADTSCYYTTNAPLFRANFGMFNLIVRGRGSIAAQLLGLGPSFISIEYGANEVLGSATSGVSTLTFPSAAYAAILTGAINAIHATLPNTKIALFNVPDVTAIPFFTTFRPFTVNKITGTPVALIGPDGPLAAGDLVTLQAGALLATGQGFPIGSYNYVNPSPSGNGPGVALPNSVVLNVAEQTAIAGVTLGMNNAVDSVSTRPFVARVDMNQLLHDISIRGYQLGSTHYTSAYITGGLFSLDGVHPNDLAHALLCNAMIDAVNARFGASVPRLNPAAYATATASAARPAGAEEGLSPPLRVEDLETGLHALFPWRH